MLDHMAHTCARAVVGVVTVHDLDRRGGRSRGRRGPIGALVALTLLAATLVAPGLGAAAPLHGPGRALSGVVVENRGQLASPARFTLRRDRQTVLFLPDGVAYVTTTPTADPRLVTHDRLVVRPIGADPQARVVGVDPQAGRVHTLRGADPEGWVTDAATFGGVAYRDLWPGVDVVYTSSAEALKSDVLVAPGADPERVAWHYHGALSIDVDADGRLVVDTPSRTLTEAPPVAWQDLDGVRVPVDAAWRVGPAGDVGTLLGPYDPDRALVIDPPLAFSTFYGGDGSDRFTGVAVSPDGGVVAAGYTTTSNLASAGAFDDVYAGEDARAAVSDGLIVKLGPDGALVWATYLGGTKTDFPFTYPGQTLPAYLATTRIEDVALTADGRVIVVGATKATDFPLAAPLFATLQGEGTTDAAATDAFVTVLDPAGHGLYLSTLLGGKRVDNALSVATLGDLVAVGGLTASSTFPVQLAPADLAQVDDAHPRAFATVLRLPPDSGSPPAIVYSNLLVAGATTGAAHVGLHTNAAGRPLLTVGFTLEQAVPGVLALVGTTELALDGTATLPAILVERIDLAAAPAHAVASAVLVDGDRADVLRDLAVDRDGSVALGGCTTSDAELVAVDDHNDGVCGTGGAGCPGAFTAPYPWSDGFVVVVTPDLVSSSGTYLGGEVYDCVEAVAFTAEGVAAAGVTTSRDFPVRAAFQTTSREPNTAPGVAGDGEELADADPLVLEPIFHQTGFVSLLSRTGELLLSTYVGGSPTLSFDRDGDFLGSLAVDLSRERLVAVGATFSSDYPRYRPASGVHGSPVHLEGRPDDLSFSGLAYVEVGELDAVVTAVRTDVADLLVSEARAEPRAAARGATTTLRVTVKNDGPKPAPFVTLDLVPDKDLQATWTVPEECDALLDGALITCELGTLARGATKELVLSYPNPEGPGIDRYTHVATARMTGRDDPNPANNKKEIVATAGGYDLLVVPQGQTGGSTVSPAVGQTYRDLTYTVVARNDGPEDADSLSLSCAVAGEVFLIDPTTAGCQLRTDVTPPRVVCALGALAKGAAKTIAFKVRPLLPAKPFRVPCTVQGDVVDEADPTNDTANLDAEVRYPDLGLVLVGTTPAPVRGKVRVKRLHTVEVGLQIENRGVDAVSRVRLALTLPDPSMGFPPSLVPSGCVVTPESGPVPASMRCEDLTQGQSLGKDSAWNLNLAFITPAADKKTRVTLRVVPVDGAGQTGDHAPLDNVNHVDVFVGGADLLVENVVESKDPVLAGEALTVRFDVVNLGPDDVTAALVHVDRAGPAKLEGLTVTGGQACLDVSAPPAVGVAWTCDQVSIAAGQKAVATATYAVDPASGAQPQQLHTVAKVEHFAAVDHDPANNTKSETTVVQDGVDMAIPAGAFAVTGKLAEKGTKALIGEVKNLGTTAAHNVALEVVAGGKATLTGARLDGGTCTRVTATRYTCRVDTLAGGASALAEVSVQAAAGAAADGSIAVNLAVSSDKPDPVTTNNARSRLVEVVPGADLAVTFATADGLVVAEEATFDVGFAIKNNGPDDATAVTVAGVSDVNAEKFELLSVSGAGCTVAADKRSLSCALTTLASGATFSATATMKSLAGLLDPANPNDVKDGRLSVSVTATPTEDPTPEGRHGDLYVSVQHGASVHLTAPASFPARVVEQKTYTASIAVRNDGPRAATRAGHPDGATLDVASLNTSTKLVAVNFGGVPCAAVAETSFHCALHSFPKGGDKPLAISVVAKEGAVQLGHDLSFRVTFTADEKDKVPSNRTLTLTRPVDLGADLSATFPSPPTEAAEGSDFKVTAHLCSAGPEGYTQDDGKLVHVGLAGAFTQLSGAAVTINGSFIGQARCDGRAGLGGWDCPVFPVGAASCADLEALVDIPEGALPADPNATGTVRTTFTVTTDRSDPTDGVQNQFVATTTVKHAMNLELGLTPVAPAPAPGQPQKVAKGGRASYAARVYNRDSVRASPPAKLTVSLRTHQNAAAMKYDKAVAGCVNAPNEAGQILCEVPPIPPGGAWPSGGTLNLDLKVIADPQVIDVGGNVRADTHVDKTPADNAKLFPVVIADAADVALVSLSVDHDPAATETTANFLAQVCNAGPTDYVAGDGKSVRVAYTLADEGHGLSATGQGECSFSAADHGWTCDALAANKCAILELAVPIPADFLPGTDPEAEAHLGLTLVASGDLPDPTPADRERALDVLVTRPTDMSVQLTQLTPAPDGSGKLTAQVGDAAELLVAVTNHASVTARGAKIAVEFNPTGAAWTLTGGPYDGCVITARALECDLPELAPNAAASASFTFKAAEAGTSHFSARTGVPFKGDKTPDDNYRELAYDVRDQTRLALTLVAPDHADVGKPFDVTLTVSQEDPTAAEAKDVRVGLAYPLANFATPQILPASTSCVASGGIVRCTVPAIVQGGSQTLTAKLIPKQAGTAVLDAEVESARDLTPANNRAEATVELGAAKLTLTATVPDPIVWDTEFDATVTLTNAGPAAALGAYYSCSLQLDGVSPFVSSAVGYVDAAHVKTSPARLAVGAASNPHRMWPRVVDVNGLICKGHQTYPDADAGDGFVQKLFTIRGADLALATSGPVSTPVGAFTVSATVTNHGPAKTGVTDVTFTLPRDLAAALPLPAGCAGVGTPIRCDLGPFAVGASATVALPLVGAIPGGYSVGVHAGADVGDDGTHPQDATEIVQLVDVDSDGDGVPDSQEAGGSPTGDANGDGVPDKDQANVGTLPDPHGQATTFVAAPDVVISQLQQAPLPPLPPAGVLFPTGFFTFRLTVAPGAATTLDLLLPAGVPAWTFWKYGPTPDQATAHWYRFDYDGTTGAERTSPTTVRLHLVDGGRGDDDLAANGAIVDPGAPALREGRLFAVQNDQDWPDADPGDGLCADANDGSCGLRAALEELDALGDPGGVIFDLPGPGPHVIAVAAPLPEVAVPLVLDASTQPGYADAPVVGLTSAALDAADGLVLTGGASTVRGLNVYGFDGDGLRFEGAGHNRVAACVIGTDLGTATADLTGRGVVFAGVGGGVIETSHLYGSLPVASVALVGPGARDNWVRANTFGLVRALTSGDQLLLDDAGANTVGGPRAADANTLTSATVGAAVRIRGADAADNRVIGNAIGLEPGGVCTWSYPEGHPCNLPDHGGLICTLCRFPNAAGVVLEGGAHDNTVGGPTRAEANAFGANALAVSIAADAPDNAVYGNTIGVFADGTCDAAHGCPDGGGLLARGPRARLGGDAPGEGNVVASGAIDVEGAAAVDTLVAHNRVGLLPSGAARTSRPDFAVRVGDGASGVTVRGNTLLAARDGVRLDGALAADVRANSFGLDPAGRALVAGGGLDRGVRFTHSNLAPNQGNVIADNAFGDARVGVDMTGGGAICGAHASCATRDNDVTGNTFGLSAEGALLGVETSYGVLIRQFYDLATPPWSPPDGPVPADNRVTDNVFASAGAVALSTPDLANDEPGPAAIAVVRATGTVVTGNRVGLAADEVTPLPGGAWGLAVRGAPGTLVQSNTFAASSAGGVAIEAYPTDAQVPAGSLVQRNIIRANGGPGVAFAHGGAVAFDVLLGGPDPADANTITDNAGAGVRAPDALGVTVRHDVLRDNGGLGLDRGPVGPDSGWPYLDVVLTLATTSGGSTAIDGHLDGGDWQASYDIDFYAQAAPDPSGFGEAETWLGAAQVTADGFGQATFHAVLPVVADAGAYLTASATEVVSGTTSELSRFVRVDAAATDLAVTLAAPTVTSVGGYESLTATVTNHGPASATAAAVVLTLPAALAYDSLYAAGGSCEQAGVVVSCALGDLAPGAEAYVYVYVVPAAAGLATITAAATTGTPDPVAANDSASATVGVDLPDLRVSAALAPGAAWTDAALVATGEPVRVELAVANVGFAEAPDAALVAELPAEVAVLFAEPAVGACETPDGQLVCDLGAVAGLDTVPVTVWLLGLAPASVEPSVVTFVASAALPDAAPADNRASVALRPRDQVLDLWVHGDASPAAAAVGEPVTVTVRLDNFGPHAASGLGFQLVVPAVLAVQDVQVVGTSCTIDTAIVHCDGGTCTVVRPSVDCPVDGLTPGAALVVTLTVVPAQLGRWTVDAFVTGWPADAFDPLAQDLTGDHVAHVPVDVDPSDLAVVIAEDADPVAFGAPLRWTTTVTNHGPRVATDVSATLRASDAVTALAVTPTVGTCDDGSPYRGCALGTLAPGASVELAVSGAAPFGTHGLEVTVATSAFDPDAANDRATAATSVAWGVACAPGETLVTLIGDDTEVGGGVWVPDAAAASWALVADGGGHVWFAPNEAAYGTRALVAGPVALPADASQVALAFSHRYDAELYYDGGTVELSTDGGASWDPDPGFFVTGAPVGPIYGHPSQSSGWTGVSDPAAGDTLTVVDLGAERGQTVLVRFALNDFGASDAGGWWVDGPQLVACEMVPVAGVDLVVTAAGLAAPTVGAPAVATVVVVNGGDTDASGVEVTLRLTAGEGALAATVAGGACSVVFGDLVCTVVSLPSGATSTVDVTVTPGVAGPLRLEVEAWTASAAEDDASNNRAALAATVTEASGAACPVGTSPALLFADDAEGATPAWTSSRFSYPADHWTPDVQRGSHSPDRAWLAWTNFNADAQVLTLSAPIAIPPEATSATLTFWHAFTIGYPQGGGVVELSSDGGASWEDAGARLSGWGYADFAAVASAGNGLDGRAAFLGGTPISGGIAGFVETRVDLSDLAGEQALVRFWLESDGAYDPGFWAIDDVAIEACLGASEPAADLSLSAAALPAAQRVGELSTWALSVANGGPEPASEVTLTVTVPAALDVASLDGPTPGGCAFAPPTVTCALGDLAVGAELAVDLGLVAVEATDGAAVIAEVTGAPGDPTPADAALSAPIAVRAAAADLGVALTAPERLLVGAPGQVRLEVTQAGPDAASDVQLTLEADGAIATATPDDPAVTCEIVDGAAVCTVAAVSAGGGFAVDVGVLAPEAPTTLALVASVHAADPADPNPADDARAASVVVETARADLSVALASDATPPVAAGAQVALSLGVSASGPDSALEAVLALDLVGPAEVVAVEAPAGLSCVFEATRAACELGDLPASQAAAVTVRVRVVDRGVVVATLSATSVTPDPTPGDLVSVLSFVATQPCAVGACDDGDPCSDDLCDAAGGCAHVFNDGSCDAGDACSAQGVCALGACLSMAAVSCDDGDPCSADWCDAQEGCRAAPVAVGACDDGDACTLNDACVAGVCTGGEAAGCDDGDPCSADSCDAAGGCQHQDIPGCCDADAECGGAVGCTLSQCNNHVCEVINAPNGSGCDDGDPCTVGDQCSAGACAGAAMACGDGEPCTLDGCVAGVCTHAPRADGSSCDDGDACTIDDACEGGVCEAAPVDCDDGVQCTSDSCDPADGSCVHDAAAADDAPCDDGDACTADEVCAGGECGGGGAVSCGDANPCTEDSCDPAGGCEHAFIAGCCTVDAHCDDLNPCTTDSCDLDTGDCAHVLTPNGGVDDGCDGVDDDCDGVTDGGWVAVATSCGVGECAGNAGVLACVDGQTSDSCDPLAGAVAESCDGLDDDCDGVTDNVPGVSCGTEEELVYGVVTGADGQPVGVVRCFAVPDGAGRCDTQADGVTLIVYTELECPGP